MALVTDAGGLARNGAVDFLAQRFSAVVIAMFGICVGGWFAINPQPTHTAFAAWFTAPAMSAFATLALVALATHAWIGMWTVATDYLRPHALGARATPIRVAFLCATAAITLLYLAWGLAVVWQLG